MTAMGLLCVLPFQLTPHSLRTSEFIMTAVGLLVCVAISADILLCTSELIMTTMGLLFVLPYQLTPHSLHQR